MMNLIYFVFLKKILSGIDPHLRDLLFGASFFILSTLVLFFWSIFFKKTLKNNPIFYFLCLGFVLFLFFGIFQYLSFNFFIFEEARKLKRVVLLRTGGVLGVSVTAFLGAWIIYSDSVWWRRLPIYIFQFFIFIFFVLATFDLFLLYFSGLHFTTTAFAHAQGASKVILDALIKPQMFVGIISLLIFSALFRFLVLRCVKYKLNLKFGFIFFCLSLFSTVIWWSRYSIWPNLPERLISLSFFDNSSAHDESQVFPDQLKLKLERFGIFYEYDDFHLVNRPAVYSTNTQSLLPEKFKHKLPNILIVFLESFSTRFTSVYNSKYPGLTTGLESMSKEDDSTVFYNFYNASTPTATGLMSLLCSFYPPTSHLEISQRGSLSGHRLMCLPEVLKNHGGYGYSGYITTVNKSYSNKDRMFGNMGADEVFGTKEMAEYIDGKPLSWGFSDHQIFPAFYKKALEISQKSSDPFLLMLSTIDTHPPYAFPRDGVKYDDGKDDALDAFHTTDHAFKLFWEDFKGGDLFDNTILLVVADHAPFPSTPIKNVFSEINDINYYDEIVLMTYIPDSLLPDKVDIRSSGVDLVPTLLQILNINIKNSFEGHSIFDSRSKYPNLIGMHDLGIYINENSVQTGQEYGVPAFLPCSDFSKENIKHSEPLSLCELNHFYLWKKRQFQQGRFWKHD